MNTPDSAALRAHVVRFFNLLGYPATAAYVQNEETARGVQQRATGLAKAHPHHWVLAR